MTAKIISGTKIAAEIREELKLRVAGLKKKGIVPALAVVLVGEDPGSISYVKSKAKGASEIGMLEETISLPETVTEEELLLIVDGINNNPKFHGVLVQLPIPKHINSENIISRISAEKDVDGFHPVNVGKLFRGEPCPLPCTPHGIQELLMRSGNDPSGKHVVICGRSNLVGKPLAGILMQKAKGANATVTLCHTGTKDIAYFTRQADILIAAMGVPAFIKDSMVTEGAVVIDVGVNRVEDKTNEKGYRLVGDVDFEKVKEKASAITPVPGGVGPMTVTMLLMNTIDAAQKSPD
jgi:methylenetetrahydrofolate dehydrogenase (NADP+) / methenyltetrahydrofolate cyclohydrolase